MICRGAVAIVSSWAPLAKSRKYLCMTKQKLRGRAPRPSVIKEHAEAGYFTPAAIVEKYGRKHDVGIKWAYKLVAAWKPKTGAALGTTFVSFGGKPGVRVDGANVWLLAAGVEQVLAERSGKR